ncbi:hypothetical protein U1Q18_020835 [Sarracenia purpurea var. burkii]
MLAFRGREAASTQIKFAEINTEKEKKKASDSFRFSRSDLRIDLRFREHKEERIEEQLPSTPVMLVWSRSDGNIDLFSAKTRKGN